MSKFKICVVAGVVAVVEMLLASLMFVIINETGFIVRLVMMMVFMLGQDFIVTYLFSLHMERKSVSKFRTKRYKALLPFEKSIIMVAVLGMMGFVFILKLDVMIALMAMLGFRSWMEYIFFRAGKVE